MNGLLPCALVEMNFAYNCLEYIQPDLSLSSIEVLDLSHNKLKLLNFLKVCLF